MKVAVVGATGFVGTSAVDALRARGASVTRVRAPRLAPVEPSLARSAVGQQPEVLEMLAQTFCGHDAVVNAAGDPSASSVAQAALVAANAVLPAVLARAAASVGVLRFIHVSSAAVQGRMRLLDETQRTEPFSAYSRSKALGEELLREEADGRAVIYRPASVHGMDRRITRSLSGIARSPVASVARPGTARSPQAHIANVGDAIAYLATCDDQPPGVVMHPWEGHTTMSLLELLGGRKPVQIPMPVARLTATALRTVGAAFAPAAANARRLEMMWFGQGQAESWLTRTGWAPPAGVEAWEQMAVEVSAPAVTRR